MLRRRRVLVALVVVALMTATTSAGAVGAGRRLPPPARDDLARIFDPMLEDLGLRTTRARLQNLRTYETDPRGRHLAIYAEPIEETFTDADYVELFVEVAQVFLPRVFKRWKGLKSFDVCLEPRPSEDARAEPPARTQLLVSRKGSKSVRWRATTLTEVLRVALEHQTSTDAAREFSVYFEAALDAQPTLADARADAAATATTTSTT
jgi:hypothetical protein